MLVYIANGYVSFLAGTKWIPKKQTDRHVCMFVCILRLFSAGLAICHKKNDPCWKSAVQEPSQLSKEVKKKIRFFN